MQTLRWLDWNCRKQSQADTTHARRQAANRVLDRPDRVLGALVDWRAVAIRALANDVNGIAPEDAARLHLFEARANRLSQPRPEFL